MKKLVAGRYLICVWEKRLKPYLIRAVKIKDVTGSRSGGLSEVILENGMSFRGTEMKTRHLFVDKDRLRGSLEAPTRANVLIFTDGDEAKKYLFSRGAESLGENFPFEIADKTAEEIAEKEALFEELSKVPGEAPTIDE